MSEPLLRTQLSRRFGLSLEQAPKGFLTAWAAEAKRRGMTPDELAGRLDDRGWDTWVNQLTVPETYFFRHKPQMEILRNFVLPRLDEFSALRLWSAGCCTGEEAYTLALLAKQRGWARRAHVWGTNLNPENVATARAGVYNRNSFREGGTELMDPLPNQHWRVREDLRSLVTFEQGNLLEHTRAGSHLVLCRNVLIYFDGASRRKVMDNLVSSLDPGGFLMLAPCEGADVRHPLLRTHRLDGGLVFEKMQYASPPTPAPEPVRAAPRPVKVVAPPKRLPTPRPARPLTPQPPPAAATLERAQRLGDQGDYAAAEAICRELLKVDPRHLGALFLRAHLADVQGDRQEYRVRLERILYDDPHAAGAYLELAHLHRSLGEGRRAERCLEAARDVLRQLPADRPVEPYGTPAGRLLEELS